jgi:D-cysteine desulfhydrase
VSRRGPDPPPPLRSTLRTRTGHLEGLVPRLTDVAPRLVLADLPTPVSVLPELARELGLSDLLVKRDDATSSLYGGTKVRGLEFFFGRALAQAKGSVVTMGSEGSNHAVATAMFAREVGMIARAVLFPHPDREQARQNVARLEALGADARPAGWLGLLPALLRGRLDRVAGTRPLWIAPGGSSGLGVLGAVEGALEVLEAVRAGTIRMPEDVVVAAGSCGTAAGLVLGFSLARAPVRVVAVRVVPRLVCSKRRILRLAAEGHRVLRAAGLRAAFTPGEVAFVEEQAGEGYARPTAEAARAVRVAGEAGVRAETTYTGKAWAHLLGGGSRGRRVLFWNTFGGLPDPQNPEFSKVQQ